MLSHIAKGFTVGQLITRRLTRFLFLGFVGRIGDAGIIAPLVCCYKHLPYKQSWQALKGNHSYLDGTRVGILECITGYLGDIGGAIIGGCVGGLMGALLFFLDLLLRCLFSCCCKLYDKLRDKVRHLVAFIYVQTGTEIDARCGTNDRMHSPEFRGAIELYRDRVAAPERTWRNFLCCAIEEKDNHNAALPQLQYEYFDPYSSSSALGSSPKATTLPSIHGSTSGQYSAVDTKSELVEFDTAQTPMANPLAPTPSASTADQSSGESLVIISGCHPSHNPAAFDNVEWVEAPERPFAST